MLWDKILLQEINEVRKRAYKDKYEEHIYVNSTKEANGAAILKERLLELAFEGKGDGFGYVLTKPLIWFLL